MTNTLATGVNQHISTIGGTNHNEYFVVIFQMGIMTKEHISILVHEIKISPVLTNNCPLKMQGLRKKERNLILQNPIT